MKKFLKIVIALLVGAAVWSITQLYNKSMENVESIVEEKITNLIILPEKPAAAEGNFTTVVLPESTGETYPWEVEFRAEDYEAFMWDQPNSKCIEWSDPNTGAVVRQLNQNPETGWIFDTYFYSSGSPGLTCEYYADGTYCECRRLDGGENYYGQIIYEREVNADGGIFEIHFNEDGYKTYYYSKNKDYYSKNKDFELELIGDETGKLIKCIQNGIVIEDADAFAHYVTFGFRE